MTAHRITSQYARGIRITDAQMAQLALLPDAARPRWNYEIRPQPSTRPAPPAAAESLATGGLATAPVPATG